MPPHRGLRDGITVPLAADHILKFGQFLHLDRVLSRFGRNFYGFVSLQITANAFLRRLSTVPFKFHQTTILKHADTPRFQRSLDNLLAFFKYLPNLVFGDVGLAGYQVDYVILAEFCPNDRTDLLFRRGFLCGGSCSGLSRLCGSSPRRSFFRWRFCA